MKILPWLDTKFVLKSIGLHCFPQVLISLIDLSSYISIINLLCNLELPIHFRNSFLEILLLVF